MARFFWSDTPPKRRKASRFFLALFWLAGWLCGLLTALLADLWFLSMMRRVLCAPVSIVGLLCASTLPFLISAVAVYRLRSMLLPVCFFRAFLSGLLSGGMARLLGPGAWVARTLLLFGDMASAPMLYWFWLRGLDGRTRPSLPAFAALVSGAVLIGSVDYRIISPFLAVLIE